MNPLENSPAVRSKVYAIFWGLGLGLGATQVGFAAADIGQPVELTVALAVYAFLGAGVGYTAGQNVTQPYRE